MPARVSMTNKFFSHYSCSRFVWCNMAKLFAVRYDDKSKKIEKKRDEKSEMENILLWLKHNQVLCVHCTLYVCKKNALGIALRARGGEKVSSTTNRTKKICITTTRTNNEKKWLKNKKKFYEVVKKIIANILKLMTWRVWRRERASSVRTNKKITSCCSMFANGYFFPEFY